MIQRIKSCCSQWCSLLLTLALMAVLGGCGTTQTTQTTPTLRVGVAVYQQSDTFISTVVQHMETLARLEEEAQDIKISLSIVDGGSNQTVQLEQIDKLIAAGCDVICVNIVDRTGAAVLIDKAEKAGIPLILFNRQPVEEDMNRWEWVYYIGAAGQQSGLLQGDIVCDLWEADQEAVDHNGDGIIQYVMLEGEQGHQDTQLRTQYSVAALTSAGISVEKLAGDTAGWNRGEAAAKVAQWISEYGDDIEVVFSNNDEMALGAIDAYTAAKLPASSWPVIVGVDAIAEALEALEAGTLQGTVLNDSEGMAENMLALSLALWRGEDPAQAVELVDDHYVWLEYRQITLDTMHILN